MLMHSPCFTSFTIDFIIILYYRLDGPSASFFFGVRIRLGTILGRFSIIYFMGLWLRIRVRVRVCGRVSVMVRVRVSVVLWSG